jgi:RNA recognition motif-containing protein
MNETYLDENFRDVDFNLTKTTYEETEEEHEDKHVTKFFVGNLPTSTTLPELLAVFKRLGPVNEKLSVVKDQNYAFIHFYNRDDAKVALQEINDSLFKDRYIRVQFSTSQGYTNKVKSKKIKVKLIYFILFFIFMKIKSQKILPKTNNTHFLVCNKVNRLCASRAFLIFTTSKQMIRVFSGQ